MKRYIGDLFQTQGGYCWGSGGMRQQNNAELAPEFLGFTTSPSPLLLAPGVFHTEKETALLLGAQHPALVWVRAGI